MEFKSKELKTKFSIPDRPTVMDQFKYHNATLAYRDEFIFWRNWVCATQIITKWESEVIPSPELVFYSRIPGEEGEEGIYLDECSDVEVADVLMWVGGQVAMHMQSLRDIPKK